MHTLLPSILGQSTTSTRPMQIYMDFADVAVSLLRFKYPATLKKTLTRNVKIKTTYFPTICFRVKHILFQKIKVKNFILVVTLLNFSYTFCFSFFLLFNVFLVSLAM